MSIRTHILGFLLVLLFPFLLSEQLAAKSYKGRQLAGIMSPEGIAWLERDTREQEEHISLLIQALDLKAGQQIADLGAGSGTITRLMAPKVLPGGQIWAVEVQDAMIESLEKLKRAERFDHMRIVKGTTTDPKLPAHSMDLILMVDVYHEFQDPESMLRAMSRALKPGGRIALVEYRAEDPKVPIDPSHKMSLKQIHREFDRADLGLKVQRIDSRLPRQHLVFIQRTK